MAGLLFILLLSLLRGCRVQCTQNCSVVINFKCDSMNKATLSTTEYYEKYKTCDDWSLRGKDDTNLKNLDPSPEIITKCLSEIRLKVHCINPKEEFLACYKVESEVENVRSDQHSNGAFSLVHTRVMIVTACLLLVMLT